MRREEFVTALAGMAAGLPLSDWARRLTKVGTYAARARHAVVATAIFACLAAPPAAAAER